jgi:hypothetical protein
MRPQEKNIFFELGDKTALICADAATADFAKAAFHELLFKFHVAETSELAIEHIRYTSYNCILLHESFAGSSLRSNVVLRYLSSLPMMQRRNTYVCLIGPSFETSNAMQAFAESVHLVLNPADLPNMEPILKKGLAEFEMMYRTYREVLAANT